MSPSNEPTHDLLYGIDDEPPMAETVALGFQHYLTMFGSTVAIPFILAEPLGLTDPADLAALIATMFFVSGITTLLQVGWGNRLPIIQGGTFSLLAPTFAICGMTGLAEVGWEVRMQHVQGAIIAGALVEIVVGTSGLVGKMLRFVGPITIAPTIALIGLSLFKFGAPNAGQHWPIGALTIGLIILFSQYLRRKNRAFELYPIVLAILGAWGVAAVCTATGLFPEGHPAHTSLANLDSAPWFRLPMPFQWGMPIFGAAAIIGMLAGYLASMVESIGDYYACARLSGAPTPDEKTVNRGITFEGIGCAIAGVFGTGNGTTSYSENIGAIGLTRVGSRRVVMAGALLMILLGTVSKFGALFTAIPSPIVGGMYCAMFGMIASVGLSNLQFVNLNSARNLFVLGFAFFMGLSVPEYFIANPLALTEDMQWLGNIVNTLGSTGMAVGAFTALVLDNTIPGTNSERGLTAFAPEGMGPPPEEDGTLGGSFTLVGALVLLGVSTAIYGLPDAPVQPEEAAVVDSQNDSEGSSGDESTGEGSDEEDSATVTSEIVCQKMGVKAQKEGWTLKGPGGPFWTDQASCVAELKAGSTVLEQEKGCMNGDQIHQAQIEQLDWCLDHVEEDEFLLCMRMRSQRVMPILKENCPPPGPPTRRPDLPGQGAASGTPSGSGDAPIVP
jgi:nucleobase transporter 1/2